MDADRPSTSAADATTTTTPAAALAAADTDAVQWSKLGVARGGVTAKRGRRETRGRGKGRPPRRVVAQSADAAKASALYFANPKKKVLKRRKSIFTRHE